MRLKQLFTLLLFVAYTGVSAQDFIALWPAGKKPNNNGRSIKDSLANERIWKVETPGVYSFLVPQAENSRTAVLLCPGGGYERISHIYNGFNMAKWYNSIGVNAFVLIYRLPHQVDLQHRETAGLQDAQRAMQLIRSKAETWKIDPHKVGVMGTSAGGHLASLLGTSEADITGQKDSVAQSDFKPDFMVLLSPVISMGAFAHPGSRKNFLAGDTSAAMVEKYSTDRRVTEMTPPTFMVHAFNDKTVPVKNSLFFYEALIAHNINASLHIFPQGGHGIRLDENPGSTDLWTALLEKWLKEMNFLVPIPFK
ncbi:MAG: Acetyl esterase/lipase [Ferruginibacter sp.]|nr:Acetyl esterase/lipase [Ferruginibacter sp.]